jgi:outer membrane protein OmpA-like peptidoglycan-associated protein
MIVSLPSRGIAAVALAAGLLLAGCSSDSDVPPVVVSAPGGGTKVNTDTGSGGEFPDVNSTPTQRPTSTIQDLNQAPEGLSGAQNGTQYGEPLVGGPSSSAEPPPPPPAPPQEELPPLPGAGVQTQTSAAAPAQAPAPSNEPIATPEVAEPQPMEPVAEPVPEPDVAAPQGQTIQGTTSQPALDSGRVQPAPMAAAPQQPAMPVVTPQPASQPTQPQQPATPVVTPQPVSQPIQPQQPAVPVVTPQPASQPTQPQAQLPLSPGSGQTQSLAATQQAQLPASADGSNYRALAPDAYGVTFPQRVLPPHQGYDAAQAMYRPHYANAPTNYGGAIGGAPVDSSQTAMVTPAAGPTTGAYGQPDYAGQPVGLIFFGEGSSSLSSDDLNVLKQIADMQRTNGGVVHVVGHASMGTSAMDSRHQQANQRISEARANAVAQQLMRYGVPEGAIQTAAAGDTQPLYSEAMPSGEAANRRAEVYLGAY